jgi:hypothetical protein
MKRLLLCVSILVNVCVLSGCPIYSTSPDSQACGPYGCYDCPAGSSPADGACIPWSCISSNDCPAGYTCGASSRSLGHVCVPIPSSTSGSADASDCSAGCPSGYVCKLSGGQTQCVLANRPPADAGGAVDAWSLPDSAIVGSDTSTAEEDSAASPDSSDASDAARATDGSSPSDSTSSEAATVVACNANADCSGGDTCINGQCTAPSELCSDTTQCITGGEACVNGICVPHCSAGAESVPCPSGYLCDFTRGVCRLNPTQCAGSGTANCQGGSTCVEGRCVAPCVSSDSGAVCPAGEICVHGGCIPNEAASFACKNDGQSGSLATSCSSSQICLHHDCYAACDPDANSPCADPSASCQSVTVNAGTYVVCAAASTLGSDCDMAVGKPCSSGVCIDGYCR